MKQPRAYIHGMGIVSSLGIGIQAHKDALAAGRSGIRPLSIFPARAPALPVGQVDLSGSPPDRPRTHRLALLAAQEAAAAAVPPDAVILGVTTGAMLESETLLKKDARDPSSYRSHGIGAVAEVLAEAVDCTGPVLAVSTACSSGAAAICLALEMIRSGRAGRVLAGGVDSLCRLTYYGFSALQLIDPAGARPLDRDRRGMSVAEGAAFLYLVADRPDNAIAEVAGGGLSCDAYHPAKPHPEGKGAAAAMRSALTDAGLEADDIGYVSLHGTGTWDNDRAEAVALRTLFGDHLPPLSSVKGAFGHTLAAAGAIEAVVAAIAVQDGLLPANTGCLHPDEALGLTPLVTPRRETIRHVLSNSFGFGGNNAALVVGTPVAQPKDRPDKRPAGLTILGGGCVTGGGRAAAALSALKNHQPLAGRLPDEAVAANLSPRYARRMKRLARLALSVAIDAHADAGNAEPPASVFFGTGWGAMSETSDFLTRLFESDEQYAGPTDFVGSVHNAAAGQMAAWFQATGANITVSGGDQSFEQALLAAELTVRRDAAPFLLVGADEGHPHLSPRFDPSVAASGNVSDGAGALLLSDTAAEGSLCIRMLCFEKASAVPKRLPELVKADGAGSAVPRYGMIWVGIPAAERAFATPLLASLREIAGATVPVIDYRRFTGEFATASAVAAVLILGFLNAGIVPAGLFGGSVDHRLTTAQGGLVIGLGRYLTAYEIIPR